MCLLPFASQRSELPVWLVTHRPIELGLQICLEDLLDRYILELAPADGDSWVHVVDSAGSEGDRFVIFACLKLHLFFLYAIIKLCNLALAGLRILGSTLLLAECLHRSLKLFTALESFL